MGAPVQSVSPVIPMDIIMKGLGVSAITIPDPRSVELLVVATLGAMDRMSTTGESKRLTDGEHE